ncbi:MAG TPA: N,N-dimethylformamidase beta subunit family domain-containing protein [Noviherbaspirillum sp.]|nr:N,N-dimethylformamidase beta subunit family domain-containing protein [Noviherbaspirillum sp.]
MILVLFLGACGGGGGGANITSGIDSRTSTEPGSQTVPKDPEAPVPPGSGTPQTGSGDQGGGPQPPDQGGGNAGGPTEPGSHAYNVIQRENAKTADDGVSEQWEIAAANYAGNHEIEGYASATSINRGESIKLYVNTNDPEYTIAVYRIGWYGGKGGRLVAGPIRRTGVKQPAPSIDAENNLVECDWNDPYVLHIPGKADDPTDWASGFYLAKLTGSRGKQSYIIFVVRDDASDSALLFQSSVTTYAAYNNWGGYSLYDLDDFDSAGGKPAYKVSFNRPYRNPMRPASGKGAGEFLTWEINMVRFLERGGYDVSYSTNIDTHRAPQQLLRHRAFLSVGHDEYWTKSMRDAIEAARGHGVSLGFFGANSGYWQVRLEGDRNGQPDRTVVAYKYDTFAKDPMYKTNPELSTYLWREAPINRPEAALVGVMYEYNSLDGDMVIADCPDWICAGTGLHAGSVLKGMLGYEVDSVAPSSPAGIVIFGSSPYSGCSAGNCRAHATYYTSPGGAGVFATGSMNWHWGLDAYNDGEHGNRETAEVKTITNNVLRHFIKP